MKKLINTCDKEKDLILNLKEINWRFYKQRDLEEFKATPAPLILEYDGEHPECEPESLIVYKGQSDIDKAISSILCSTCT
jgi:hypothetical protein